VCWYRERSTAIVDIHRLSAVLLPEVQANSKAAMAHGVSGAFNLGSGTRIAINQLTEHITEIGGPLRIWFSALHGRVTFVTACWIFRPHVAGSAMPEKKQEES